MVELLHVVCQSFTRDLAWYLFAHVRISHLTVHSRSYTNCICFRSTGISIGCSCMCCTTCQSLLHGEITPLPIAVTRALGLDNNAPLALASRIASVSFDTLCAHTTHPQGFHRASNTFSAIHFASTRLLVLRRRPLKVPPRRSLCQIYTSRRYEFCLCFDHYGRALSLRYDTQKLPHN